MKHVIARIARWDLLPAALVHLSMTAALATESAGARASGAAFIHPGLLHTRAELDFVMQKIAAGEEPWRSRWERLLASPLAAPEFVPTPRAEVVRGAYNNPNIGSSDFSRDVAAAYTQALRWCLAGDEIHALKAIEILNAWSSTLKVVSGHDTKLLIGMAGADMRRSRTHPTHLQALGKLRSRAVGTPSARGFLSSH